MKHSDQIYTRHFRELLEIFKHALHFSHPYNLVQEKIQISKEHLQIAGSEYDIKKKQDIWVLGSGKASSQMALALEDKLGDHIKGGLIICPHGSKTKTRTIRQMEASHPVPDEKSVEATREMTALIKRIKADDLVIYVMSGGSSSLLCLPPEELTLDSIQKTYHVLLNSGANIREMNIVRKNISRIKGGRMGRMLREAKVINLVISDVPGDIPEDIGSGPLVPDTTTFSQAMQVLDKYDIKTKLPVEIVDYIQKGIEGKAEGTVTEEFPNHVYYLLGNAHFTAQQAKQKASELGYAVYLPNQAYSGEVRTVSESMCRAALNVLEKDSLVAKPAALIYYGESYVNVTGKGKGGRNQELALHASLRLDGFHHISMLSAGTDGRDGPTDAAGAICNGYTVSEARQTSLDPEKFLEENDSYHFFEAIKGLVKTGYTDNNVMDLQIILVEG